MKKSHLYSVVDFHSTLTDNRLAGLWRVMHGFRGLYLLGVLALALSVGAKTAGFLLLQYFIDDVLLAPTTTTPFYGIALAFVGLAVFEGVFTFLSGRWSARAAEGIALRLRNYLYDHLQRLKMTYFAQTKTGEIVQRCSSDVDALRRFFSEQSIALGQVLMLFLINFIALLSINVQLALITVIIIPVLMVLSFLFFGKINESYEANQGQEGHLSAVLQENLSGVRVVKAFAAKGMSETSLMWKIKSSMRKAVR